MTFFRSILFAIFFLVWASTLRAEVTAPNTDTLSLSDTTATLTQTFKVAPVWRTGGVQVGEKPKPLSDPSFSWAAGYIWDHAPPGIHAPWPLPKKNFPAWTSDGNADADPNGDMIR